MITTAILSVIWGIIEPPLSLVPDVAINYDGLANSSVYQYLRAALYLMPMEAFTGILSISITLWGLRMFIAFFRTLWAALPIV